jgi:ApbE superfamily uncharacterized protein (UPF0280 family)
MPLLGRKATHFDVPVQDVVLRVTGPEDLYEEARAAGMQFWEQVQSYAIRNPSFRQGRSPVEVGEDAPPIALQMARQAALAGVGPMATLRGALTEFVGRTLLRSAAELVVSSGSSHFVATRRRARMVVHPGGRGGEGLALVLRPELGPHGVHTTSGRLVLPGRAADGVVVVARTCILADAAAAGAAALLSRSPSLRAALAYLQQLPGVIGALVVREERIGVAGSLELVG